MHMQRIACRFPKERVVVVRRAKSFTFNRTISSANFRQPERHQRLTPCCALWKKPRCSTIHYQKAKVA